MNVDSSSVSKLLTQAIECYQVDVVGWIVYCTTPSQQFLKEKKKNTRLPSLELLRIQDRMNTQVHVPNYKKIYDSRQSFLEWLHVEHLRDQAFYETILKNPQRLKSDSSEQVLNREIDVAAKEYLQSLQQKNYDEAEIIKNIPESTWEKIKNNSYPKVMLGFLLGASEEAVVNNFGVYFLSRLKAQFAGSRTALLSSSGPNYWHELDRCDVELTYFKNTVVNPCLLQIKKQ